MLGGLDLVRLAHPHAGLEVHPGDDLLQALEARYKAPFPPAGTETLAGGLSNTIAGRICNQFDLKGGGYTVDGAQAMKSSAVADLTLARMRPAVSRMSSPDRSAPSASAARRTSSPRCTRNAISPKAANSAVSESMT